MEVAEHGIGFPTANQLDGVGIDASTEERSRASGAKAASLDFGWLDIEGIGTYQGYPGAQSIRHLSRGDVTEPAGGVAEGAKRGSTGEGPNAKIDDPPHQSCNGADERGSTAAVRNHFATNAILLGSEDELGVGGGVQFRNGAREDWERTRACKQAHVSHGKRGVVERESMLPRPQEEEKAETYHIGYGRETIINEGWSVGSVHNGLHNLDGNGFDPRGRRVLLLVVA